MNWEPVVPAAKITDYLLNLDHPVGRPKAEFFIRHGFSTMFADVFASALISHYHQHGVTNTKLGKGGITLVSVDGQMLLPDGQIRMVRSCWWFTATDPTPRLSTAHPLDE